MRRRDLIGALAGGAAVALVGDCPLASAQSGARGGRQAQSGKPLLAFSCYGMKKIPVREAIGHIAKIGYKALELTLIPGWDTEPKLLSKTDRAEIRKRIGDLGLSLTSVQESVQLAEPNAMVSLGFNLNYNQRENLEHLRAAAAVAHELSPGAPAVIESPVGGRSAAWEETKHQMADELGVWARTLEPLNTVLAIKGFVGNALDRPEKVLWMLDQVKSPWIRNGYDYSHYRLLGLGLRETLQQVAGRTVFIHVKDSAGTPEKFRFLLPGDSGTIDYQEYARILGDIGYRGPVTVEVSVHVSNQPGYDGVAAAKHSFDNLAPFFA
jgi:sugar phosphate isomerase/epimerase